MGAGASHASVFTREVLFNSSSSFQDELNFFLTTNRRTEVLKPPEQDTKINYREPVSDIEALTKGKFNVKLNMDIIFSLLWWIWSSGFDSQTPEKKQEASDFLKIFLENHSKQTGNKHLKLVPSTGGKTDKAPQYYIDPITPNDTQQQQQDSFLRAPESPYWHESPISFIIAEHPSLYPLLEVLLEHVPASVLSSDKAIGDALLRFLMVPIGHRSFLYFREIFGNPAAKFNRIIDGSFPDYRQAYLVLAHHAPLKSGEHNLVTKFCSDEIFSMDGRPSTNSRYTLDFSCWQKKMDCAVELWRDLLSSGKVTDDLIFEKHGIQNRAGDDYKARLKTQLQKYAPDKAAQADALLAKYVGKEDKLLEALVKKYGPEERGENSVEKAVREGHPEIAKVLISHVMTSSHVDLEVEFPNLLKSSLCDVSLCSRDSMVHPFRSRFKMEEVNEFLDSGLCDMIGAILSLPGAAKWKKEYNDEKVGLEMSSHAVLHLPKLLKLMEANGLEVAVPN